MEAPQRLPLWGLPAFRCRVYGLWYGFTQLSGLRDDPEKSLFVHLLVAVLQAARGPGLQPHPGGVRRTDSPPIVAPCHHVDAANRRLHEPSGGLERQFGRLGLDGHRSAGEAGFRGPSPGAKRS